MLAPINNISSVNSVYNTGNNSPVYNAQQLNNSDNNSFQLQQDNNKKEKVGLLRAWLQNTFTFTGMIFTILGIVVGVKVGHRMKLSKKQMLLADYIGGITGHLIGISFSSFEKYAHHSLQDFADKNISNPILKDVVDFVNKFLLAIITGFALLLKTGLSIWSLQDAPKEKVHKTLKGINENAVGYFFRPIFTWWNKLFGHKVTVQNLKGDNAFEIMEKLPKSAQTYINNVKKNKSLNFFQKGMLLGTGHFIKFQASLKDYQIWKKEGKFNKKVLLGDMPKKALGEIAWLIAAQYVLAGIRGAINKFKALDEVEDTVMSTLPINIEEEKKEKLVTKIRKASQNEEVPARKVIDLQAIGLSNNADENN